MAKLSSVMIQGMKKTIFTSDKYKKARGGYSRLLRISCEKCESKVCLYQKDGPGMLKRMYIDRMIEPCVSLINKELRCPSCKETIGIRIIYKKEQRPAYRLFAGAIAKKIINSHSI